MAENKVVKNSSEEMARQSSTSNVFGPRRLMGGPIVPFGDLFGINPFAFMREFTKEMDRAFSSFPTEEFTFKDWVPTIEMKETNGNLVVTADLPGINKQDINVEISDRTLTIQGERKMEKNEEKEGLYRSERRYGRFYRSILLPDTAKTDQIKAEMHDGVLELKVPLTESKRTRQIPVSATGGAKEPEKKTTAA